MKPNLQKIFERAYTDNADGLFRFARYRVPDRETAIDIVEDAYLKFWQTLQKEKVEEPRALLYRIARNLVIDWYKKKKSIPVQSFPEASPSNERVNGEIYLDMFAGKMTGADESAEINIVLEKIGSLEPMYREAVYLRLVEELSPKEIAAILGESTNVVSVRINRGIKLLKLKLHI